MPRKRRRTAWTAASEASSIAYAPADTEMTKLSTAVFRIARAEKPARQLHFPRDDIADFPLKPASHPPSLPIKKSSQPNPDPDDVAVLSFDSDAISPALPVLPASDPIDESPTHPPSTPSQNGFSALPTPPTAFVARSLLPAMNQAGPTPDAPAMRSASKPVPPQREDKHTTPLMITTSEIRRAQQTLGLSPDAPGNSGLRFLDPELERELRAVLSSTRKMMLDVDDPSPSSGRSQRVMPMNGVEGEEVVDAGEGNASRQLVRTKACSHQAALLTQAGTTPVRARRRLSDMSTVTPIPLNLESPAASKDGERPFKTPVSERLGDIRLSDSVVPLFTNGKGAPIGMPSFTNGKGVPIPITSRQNRLASPVTPLHRHRNNEKRQASRPPSDARSDVTPQAANAPIVSLFKTGKGDTLHTLPGNGPSDLPLNHFNSVKTPLNSTTACPPLFMTGSGKKLNVPPLPSNGSGSVHKRADAPFPPFMPGKKVNVPLPLFMTGSGKTVDIPPWPKLGTGVGNKGPDAVAPLFRTGSGKKVDIPSLPKHDSGSAQKSFDVASLLATGRGNAVPLPKQSKAANIHARPPPSPQTPTIECGLRKSVFREPARGHSAKKAGRGVAGTRNSVDSGNRRTRAQGQARTGLKSTPFKRPRQLLQPEKSAVTKKVTCGPKPNIRHPPLLRSGRIACQVPQHHCSDRVASSSCSPPSFLLKVGCLGRCLNYSFTKDSFGDVGCFSSDVMKVFSFDSLTEFGIENCIQWMKRFFPTVAAKPASCIGSVAWTKLVYGLAVWKLGRLDIIYNDSCGTDECRFLCAANVVREFLRRVSFEWHGNRQPHLLRMMRRDSAPASHVVLIIADIEESEEKHLLLTVSDGWYIARAVIDTILEKRILHGKLRIGEKVHIAGAGLQSVSVTRDLFCGDGDELCSNVLRVCSNNLRKLLNHPRERLGIQRIPLVTNSLRWVKDDGGQCPTVRASVLRSYPIFYIETLPSKEQGDIGNEGSRPEYIFRREDAEFEARTAFEEDMRQNVMAAAEEKDGKLFGGDEDVPKMGKRDIRCAKEVLVCGMNDDPRDPAVRKTVRIYNPPEDVQTLLAKEGRVLLMAQLWPKQHRWTGRPEGILPPRQKIASDLLSLFPRKICSILDLQCGELAKGLDFDGVFILLHISSRSDAGERRFAYFADEVGNEIRVLALEMSGSDVDCLPNALRVKIGHGPNFPLVVLRDIEFQAISPRHDLVHARATLRSSFTSSKAISRSGFANPFKESLPQLEAQVRKKETQLEILKEAVISFASGTRESIGAYFTSTQDM